MNEAEKLKAAADAYKLDMLQQKLAEQGYDLRQARDRTEALEKDNTGEHVTMWGIASVCCGAPRTAWA